MARNPYISQTVRSEQDLYENIIIESIKIYGQNVQYMPRTLVSEDKIFGEDVVSRFDDAYTIEMYLENIDGFDGDQDLFSKFGVEIRDRATLHVSRKVWNRIVGSNVTYDRPNEGDLIYLPLSDQIFEIMRVVDDQPFYQLSNLPTYRMEIELFEYNDEDFDTGVNAIDEVEALGNRIKLTLAATGSNALNIGENVEYLVDSAAGPKLVAEIVAWDASTNILEVAHVGSTDGQWRTFSAGTTITSTETSITKTISSIGEELQQVFSQNADFETEGDNIIDFSEGNPFGEVT
ncbi:hypothetical protein OAA38_00835 [bacterium]|nr:hypothetical protein [bacterium]|tara:strand:- start:1765 stop:2637 length:873 start_codon:yes stop_codon:yes gene_type:complete